MALYAAALEKKGLDQLIGTGLSNDLIVADGGAAAALTEYAYAFLGVNLLTNLILTGLIGQSFSLDLRHC